MGALLLVSLLAAASPTSDRDAATTITSLVTAALAVHKELAVVSSADVRRVVAFEADKQAMGCTDDGACLAEVADAMGARLVVFGDLGRLGSTLVLTLNLFDSQQGAAVGRVVVRAATLDEIGAKVDGAVEALVREFLAQLAAQPTPQREPARVIVLDVKAVGGAAADGAVVAGAPAGGGPQPLWLWSGVGATALGVVGLGAGAALAGLSLAAAERGKAAPVQTVANAAYDERDLYGIGAYALWAVGGATLVAGGALIGVAFVTGGE